MKWYTGTIYETGSILIIGPSGIEIVVYFEWHVFVVILIIGPSGIEIY